jgi:hypothetical protein
VVAVILLADYNLTDGQLKDILLNRGKSGSGEKKRAELLLPRERQPTTMLQNSPKPITPCKGEYMARHEKNYPLEITIACLPFVMNIHAVAEKTHRLSKLDWGETHSIS